MRRLSCELAIALILLTCAGVSLSWYAPLTIDDAFITFTYAKHAARGDGLVFNIGERVEATSSMLWALLLVPFEVLSIGSLIGSKILGLLFYCGSLYFSYRAAEHFLPSFPTLGSRRCLALLAPLLAASSATFAAWTLQGMENALVAFLLIYGTYQYACELERRSGTLSCVPIALMGLARPEGFAFYSLFIFVRLAFACWTGLLTSRWLVWWCLGLAVIIVPYELWGLFYYGSLLPNTVGAKVSGVDYTRFMAGIDYLLSVSTSQSAWLAAITLLTCAVILVVVGICRGSSPARNTLAFVVPAALTIGLQLCFTVFTGGDWMPGGRFVSHLGPLLAASFIVTWGALHAIMTSPHSGRWRALGWRTFGGLACLGFVSHGVLATLRDQPIAAWVNGNSENAIRPIIRHINRAGTASDVIACSDIGRIGYYFVGSVFDWWGLASPEVVALGQAMGKIAAPTVLAKHPRYIVLYGATPDLNTAEGLGGFGGMSKSFVENEEFIKNYRVALTTQFTHGRYHILYERINHTPGVQG